jgi:hypothetical protein
MIKQRMQGLGRRKNYVKNQQQSSGIFRFHFRKFSPSIIFCNIPVLLKTLIGFIFMRQEQERKALNLSAEISEETLMEKDLGNFPFSKCTLEN